MSNCACCDSTPEQCTCWDFPGWGKVRRATVAPQAIAPPADRLGEWRATALCANDITSSCLYVSALATLYAGPLAPLALLAVAGILYLFRWIYAEVGEALPLNGGAYNVLLNSASKRVAAMAAALTVLSYMATAVISASEAMHYLEHMAHGLPVVPATMVLLTLFATLAISGLTESATVALIIFVFHIATLTVLGLTGVAALVSDPGVLFANLALPMSAWPTPTNSLAVALFFGLSAGLLGISGFESSANFIEEQEPGVFPKTLRNMWIAVAIFNPLIAGLAVGLLPLGEVAADKEALLATLAARAPTVLGSPAVGEALAIVVSIDAVIVLSGAVLTAFVGVTGLLRRMALDLVLPQVLLRRNRIRGTNHWIVISFLVLCISVLWLTDGRLEALAAVYTLSFLAVMALFATGNLLLKTRRPDLPRPIEASVPVVVTGLGAVLLGAAGNVLLDVSGVRVFAVYLASALLVLGMLAARNTILAAFLRHGAAWVPALRPIASQWLHDHTCRVIVFATSEVDAVEAVADYVLDNEPIRHVEVVLFDEQGPSSSQVEAVQAVDQARPGLRIDVVGIAHPLTAATLAGYASDRDIPTNHVFVGSADASVVRALPGVRLVL